MLFFEVVRYNISSNIKSLKLSICLDGRIPRDLLQLCFVVVLKITRPSPTVIYDTIKFVLESQTTITMDVIMNSKVKLHKHM
jgi:hypothetical protein